MKFALPERLTAGLAALRRKKAPVGPQPEGVATVPVQAKASGAALATVPALAASWQE